MYVFGGVDSVGVPQRDLWAFNSPTSTWSQILTASHTWTRVADLPLALSGPAGAYVAGGSAGAQGLMTPAVGG